MSDFFLKSTEMLKPGTKLGLLGGSFNPFHLGHLRVGIEVLECLKLDHLVFLPAYTPPHKTKAGMLAFEDRLKCSRLSCFGLPCLSVSDIESHLPSPSYTVNTLSYLSNCYPDIELYFVIGASDLNLLPQWYQGNSLVSRANLVITDRGGASLMDVDRFVRSFWKGKAESEGVWLAGSSRIFFCSVPRLEISSSLIREKMDRGLSIRGLVPDAAYDFITGLNFGLN